LLASIIRRLRADNNPECRKLDF